MKIDWAKPRKMEKCKASKCTKEAAYYGYCFDHFMAKLDEWREQSRKSRLIVGMGV
jgi:hypothetical protein